MPEDNKRLYFLQLPRDFFGSRRIKKLRTLPNGDSLVLLYLKIQLSTLNTGGVIELSGLEDDPADEIALEISEKPDEVKTVLDFMLERGLAETLENGNIFLPYVEIMTTSHTEEAERKRKYRSKKKDASSADTGQQQDSCGTSAGQCPGQCTDRIKSKEYRAESIEQKSIDTVDQPSPVKPTLPDNDCTFSDENVCGTRIVPRKDVKRVEAAWNALGLTKIMDIRPDTKRGAMVKRRILDYGVDSVLEAIRNVGESDFLMGRSGSFQATFDWIIKPNNFQKVLEGNYKNRNADENGTDNIFLKMLEEENGQK